MRSATKKRKCQGRGSEVFGRVKYRSGGQRKQPWESDLWVHTWRKRGSQPCSSLVGEHFGQREGLVQMCCGRRTPVMFGQEGVNPEHSEQEEEWRPCSRGYAWGAVQTTWGWTIPVCRIGLPIMPSRWVGADREAGALLEHAWMRLFPFQLTFIEHQPRGMHSTMLWRFIDKR